MEEEAEFYLAQLVDRSMLQVVDRNEIGRLKAFRMHDVVREVTLEISKNMRFCMILEGSGSVFDDQARRLSIQTNDQSLDLDRSPSLSRLRSLVMFSTCNFSSGSQRAVSFKMLRVLELNGTPISNLPNEVSTSFNLHYLGLRDTNVKRLPNNIQKLQSLQTLDLYRSRIWKLPRGVTELKQLRHLFLTNSTVEFGGPIAIDCVPVLERAWQWKNLQTLQYVIANENLVRQLGDMKELRSLTIMEVKYAHCPRLCTSLTMMSNLHSLCLSARQFDFEMLNSPPPSLQKLSLHGRLFEGKMPRFICSCPELTSVRLFQFHIIEDPLPSLRQLHKLVELRLWADAYDGQKLHFRTCWFLNLKVLFLGSLKNLYSIVIEEGAMTNLYQLIMFNLRKLKMVPHGIEFLIHLQSLSLSYMSEELVEKLTKEDDDEDRQRIRHISKITIN